LHIAVATLLWKHAAKSRDVEYGIHLYRVGIWLEPSWRLAGDLDLA
jgi:hypothetical protein